MAVQATLQSLTALLKSSSLDDHEEILKHANSVLKKTKADLDALHVKLIALLKLDRYEDALRVIEEGGDKLKEKAQLEWAYSLYKAGKLQEAEQVAGKRSVPITKERAMQHIEAQAAYRLERFSKVTGIYRELSGQTGYGEENDLRINLGATDAQLIWSGHEDEVVQRKASRDDLEDFESAYNAACSCIARGQFAQAQFLLKRAGGKMDDLQSRLPFTNNYSRALSSI
jgi:signal recognition particle subunit SRP72